jgi:hypothetical protein
MLNYKAILPRPRLLSGAAGHRQSDDDCLRQRKFAEAGAKRRVGEQHFRRGIFRADSNAQRSLRVRATASRSSPAKGAHEFYEFFDSVMAGLGFAGLRKARRGCPRQAQA